MAPDWALFPLIVLATAATVIASQALITAAFSVTKQAMQLGYLPRLRIAAHLGARDRPDLRALRQLGAVRLHRAGGGAVRLAAARWPRPTASRSRIDMTITTVMTFFVIRYAWKLPLALCVAATGFFFVVDIVFFAANVREGARRRLVPAASSASACSR